MRLCCVPLLRLGRLHGVRAAQLARLDDDGVCSVVQRSLRGRSSTHSIDYPVEINACSQPPGTRRRCFDNELYLLHTKCLDGGKAHDRVAKSSRDPDRVQAASGKRCRILQDNASTPMGRLPW